MDHNLTPDYDLSIAADASVSRCHAAPGKMVTISSESPICHPPLVHESRVQELDGSYSTAAKNPLEIRISHSFTFLHLPLLPLPKKRRAWIGILIPCLARLISLSHNQSEPQWKRCPLSRCCRRCLLSRSSFPLSAFKGRSILLSWRRWIRRRCGE